MSMIRQVQQVRKISFKLKKINSVVIKYAIGTQIGLKSQTNLWITARNCSVNLRQQKCFTRQQIRFSLNFNFRRVTCLPNVYLRGKLHKNTFLNKLHALNQLFRFRTQYLVIYVHFFSSVLYQTTHLNYNCTKRRP